MLSETLAAGLERYRIGPKIKALRLKKKLGLAQLGEHSGLSPALLSKIERSQIFPTLPTLLRVAMVFGVGLDYFFTEKDEKPLVAVVRKKERVRLPDRPNEKRAAYLFESLNFPVDNAKLEAFYATFPAGAPASEPHAHDGIEFLYIVKGDLALTIAEAETVLGAGDAIYFDSAAPHSYRAAGDKAASAIVAVAP